MRSWCSRNIQSTSSFKCHLAGNGRSHQYAPSDLLQQYQQSLISQNGVICAGRASCHNLTGLDYFAGDSPLQGTDSNWFISPHTQGSPSCYHVSSAPHLLQKETKLMQNSELPSLSHFYSLLTYCYSLHLKCLASYQLKKEKKIGEVYHLKKPLILSSITILHILIMPNIELTLHLENQWVKAKHEQVLNTVLSLSD